MEIPIKANVQCTDGPAGELAHVVVHPANKKVTRIVVKESNAPHVERIVPFMFVQGMTADVLCLQCSRRELSRMQAFVREESIKTTSYDWRRFMETKRAKYLNILEDERALDTYTRIRATDGKAGRIGELMVEAGSGKITHLVVREGAAWARRAVMVPIDEVKQMGEKAVYLRTNKAGIEALPTVSVLRK